MKINKERNYLKQLQKKHKEYNRKNPNAYFPFIKQDAGNVEVNNQVFNASVDTTVSGIGTSGGLGEDYLQTDLKNKKRTGNTDMKKKLTLKESVFEPISKQFGRWRVEVHTSDWNPNKLSATFYDMAQDKEVFPKGQNTGATYYVDTLLGKDGYGRAISEMPKLSLVGDIPEWTVSHDDLVEIQDWLEEVTKKDLDEGYSNSLIDEVIMHFRGDLGKEPKVEDVLRYIKRVHPEEVPTNYDEYDKWEEYITYKISTRLGESLDEDEADEIEWEDPINPKHLTDAFTALITDDDSFVDENGELDDAATILIACGFLNKPLSSVKELRWGPDYDYCKIVFKDGSEHYFYSRGVFTFGIKDAGEDGNSFGPVLRYPEDFDEEIIDIKLEESNKGFPVKRV